MTMPNITSGFVALFALLIVVHSGSARAADPLQILLQETGHECRELRRSTTLDGDLVADCGNAIWRIRDHDQVETLAAWPQVPGPAVVQNDNENWDRVVFWDTKCREIRRAWKAGALPNIRHWKDTFTCQRWVTAWMQMQ